jgi:hypothetical protein
MFKDGLQWATALRTMYKKEYWNLPNTIEFFAFMTKAVIIFPGLVFGIQIWWLYILAFISSISLIWTSTVKTLPTIIWFNIIWTAVSGTYLLRHFEVLP